MSSNIPTNLFSKYILRFWNVHDNSYHLNSFLVRLRISKWHQITVNKDWTKCTWFLLPWSHTDNERDNITKQTVGCHSLQALLERSRGYGRWRLTTGLTGSRPDTHFKCWGFSTPTHDRKLNYPFDILSEICIPHIQSSHKKCLAVMRYLKNCW